MQRDLDTRSAALFRLRGPALDLSALERVVTRFEGESAGPNQRTAFSDGAVVLLAALFGLQHLPRALDRFGLERARDAIVWVTEEQGDARLFCSEFVFRALRAAGTVPQRPADPRCGCRCPERPARRPAHPVRRTLRLLRMAGFDPGRTETMQETWRAWKQAWRSRRRVNSIDEANYWTPQDFADSPSYVLAARTSARSLDWVERRRARRRSRSLTRAGLGHLARP